VGRNARYRSHPSVASPATLSALACPRQAVLARRSGEDFLPRRSGEDFLLRGLCGFVCENHTSAHVQSRRIDSHEATEDTKKAGTYCLINPFLAAWRPWRDLNSALNAYTAAHLSHAKTAKTVLTQLQS
jgi:hypothetical protein